MGTDYLMMNGMNNIRAVMIRLVKNIKELIIQNKVVKDMSRYLVVFIPMIVAMCLTGCERIITEYREHNIRETEALSEQEEVDVNEQDVVAKGYNLPIIQRDI